MAEKISSFFNNYLQRQSLFKDKIILQSNYVPDEINHRDEQIQLIARIIAPALRLERPSNLFIYGKTGTGKTVTARHTLNNMIEVAKEQNIPLRYCYINCKMKRIADTEYRLIAELSRLFGKAVPTTGLPTDEIYNIFHRAIDDKRQIIILILDEIDQLVKKIGDEIIYNLTRINTDLKNAQICLIGISNDLIFSNTLDPRVKSSLSEEELIFPPYNALQLQQILQGRATKAFRDDVLEDGVIQKCAAYAAREHGDARRALELLRVAGEVAERNNCLTVSINHIDEAEEKIERERIVDVIRTQPKQFHATLQAILLLSNKRKSIFTGDVYDVYKAVCQNTGQRPLTQRRISDIIAEMDMLGIINAKVISKGRFGRMREITLGLPESLIPIITHITQTELGLHDATALQEVAAQEKLDAFEQVQSLPITSQGFQEVAPIIDEQEIESSDTDTQDVELQDKNLQNTDMQSTELQTTELQDTESQDALIKQIFIDQANDIGKELKEKIAEELYRSSQHTMQRTKEVTTKRTSTEQFLEMEQLEPSKEIITTVEMVTAQKRIKSADDWEQDDDPVNELDTDNETGNTLTDNADNFDDIEKQK